MMELKDTVAMMGSADYKERFKAEYFQTKIRYEKLKAFNNRIEASNMTRELINANKRLEMPKHDCPDYLLRDQQRMMGEYLHILEVRAVIEGIDLSETTQQDVWNPLGQGACSCSTDSYKSSAKVDG